MNVLSDLAERSRYLRRQSLTLYDTDLRNLSVTDSASDIRINLIYDLTNLAISRTCFFQSRIAPASKLRSLIDDPNGFIVVAP